jgi:hypothetical protein
MKFANRRVNPGARPRPKPVIDYNTRALRELTDKFHHPQPIERQGGFFCVLCGQLVYYSKRKGWSHERIKRQDPVVRDIEGQIPLF